MDSLLRRRAVFALERWIQRGVLHQLMLMAGLIVSVAVLGGVVAWAATTRFDGPAEAAWWAFLRLTDPGYLGDDEGAVLRVVSTIVTVLGYVIFMGSLIAILTQGLARTIRRLESGLTPIAMKDHVVVLGWTNRTPEVVLKLLGAEGRLDRFLARRDAAKLRVVVLADEVGAERRQEMRDYLGPLWNESQVFLRSGSSLHPEHLQRLDLKRASVILVPGADFELGGAERTDTRVVKTLLTIDRLLADAPPDRRPQVVAEVFDTDKAPLARGAVTGRIEVVASDRVLSRIISQLVRHRGLAPVLLGLLSHREGNSLYLRGIPELAGASPHALHERFREAVVLGFVRGGKTHLDPARPARLEPEDLLLFLAERYDRCQPGPGNGAPAVVPEAASGPHPAPRGPQRILVLGWSHKLAALVEELDASGGVDFEITVMSRVPGDERQRWLAGAAPEPARVSIRHLQGDYGVERDLARVEPASFDNIVLLSSAWMDSGEAADARTILGAVLLRSLLVGAAEPPEILVELVDPDNAHLFEEREDIVLVSPRLMSHLLAHVALRPELNPVFEELFGAGGAEITLRTPADLGLEDHAAAFPRIQRAALAHGAVALGVLVQRGREQGVHLNPPREREWTLGEDVRIVVLDTNPSP